MRIRSALVLLLVLPAVGNTSELVVLDSTSADYQVSDIVTDDTTIVLAEDDNLTLIAEDGAIYLLTGPYVGEPAGDDTQNLSGVLDALGQLVGNAEASAGDIGGVRGIDDEEDFLAQRVDDNRANPWLLHTGLTGPQCVRPDMGPAIYWRENSDNDELLRIKNIATGQISSVTWRPGEYTVAWPTDLPMQAGDMYLLRIEKQIRSANIHLRQLPNGVAENGAGAVAFLAASGCIAQARIELGRLQRSL